MSSDIKTDNALPREPAADDTAPTSMSLPFQSTVYDKKSFELSVTTRSMSLPFPSASMFKLPDDNDKLAFTIPFNSIFRRLLDNDLYNERLLCVINGGDSYYGANLINSLCGVLSSSSDTFVISPQVKSQEVSVVRQTDATIEEAMKNKLGYNYAYHQRLIANGTLKTPGENISSKMYDEYINFLKGMLSDSVARANTYIRCVPTNVHFASFYNGRYYFGTNHGLFMSINPFLENALCSQASVIWPYGYNDGERFVDDDSYDILHAGLFNATVVKAFTGKTMRGEDVFRFARANPSADVEEFLPRFDVYSIAPITFLSSYGTLSSVEAIAGTSQGLWALVNTSTVDDSTTEKTETIDGWEEDQVSATIVSYKWVAINETCTNPNGETINLNNLKVTSIVKDEENPTTLYLGTTNGLFMCKLKGISKSEDQYGNIVCGVLVDFKYVYGYYDASISGLVYVHPQGYDSSVLAATDYGVLHAANSWFPDIKRTQNDWLANVDFSTNAVTGIGLQSGIPRIVSLSSSTVSALYKITSSGLTPIYTGVVHGIFGGVLDGAWVTVAYKKSVSDPNRHDVEIMKIPESSNPPVLTPSNGLFTIKNCTGIKKCIVSPTGSIYFTVSGGGKEDIVYQISRRTRTNENKLDLKQYKAKAGEPVLGFAVLENNKLKTDSQQDIIFVATRSSIYTFMAAAESNIDFLTPIGSIDGSPDVNVLGNSRFSEFGINVMFYQNSSGTYIGNADNFATATQSWKKINDVGYETALDDTIESLVIPNYGRIISTRGGVFNAGLNESGQLWVGKNSSDPSPEIEGSFTGMLLLDNVVDEGQVTSIKFLLLVGLEDSNRVLYLYSIDTDADVPQLKFEEKITGVGGSSAPRIVQNPFNGSYQLSAMIVKNNMLNNVSVNKGVLSSEFNPSDSTQAFTNIIVNM